MAVRGVRSVVFAASVVAAAVFAVAPAQAAFPGANGKIAFEADAGGSSAGDVYLVNPDNTGLVQLTTHSAYDGAPAWSPDGGRIAFVSSRDGNREIYVMNADGTAQTRVTNTAASELNPTWSPNGTRIAFVRSGSIHVMNADGTDQVPLTTGAEPDWSPDGTRIAFTTGAHGMTSGEIFVIDADGTDRSQVTPSDPPFPNSIHLSSFSPDWLPDGIRIAFIHETWDGDDLNERYHQIQLIRPDGTGLQVVAGDGSSQLTTVLAASPSGARIAFDDLLGEVDTIAIDGSDRQHLTVTPSFVSDVDWQPLPVNTPSTYVRPKAASPVFVPLVPAYATCTAPNRVHAAPLSFQSCSPPDHLSPTLTVGVGDGSPAFSRSVGSVRLAALPGVPGGVDDADLRIRLSITNVMRKSDLSEYTGELGLDVPLALTDKEGAVAQTTMPFTLSTSVPCTPTPDLPFDGATCFIDTTAEALIPGAITEGARQILALDPDQVRDGGPDEDADTPAGEGSLATQGVFVP